jgi:hypothetical protein
MRGEEGRIGLRVMATDHKFVSSDGDDGKGNGEEQDAQASNSSNKTSLVAISFALFIPIQEILHHPLHSFVHHTVTTSNSHGLAQGGVLFETKKIAAETRESGGGGDERLRDKGEETGGEWRRTFERYLDRQVQRGSR